MAVTSSYQSKLTVTRTFDTTSADGGTATIRGDTTQSRTATTTPAVTQAGSAEKAMTAGAGTIDLTALALQFGGTVDLTGLRLRHWKIAAPATNAGSITISKGASNGFTGFGANFSITLPPGGEWLGSDAGHANPAAVAAGVKTLDLAGTGTDEIQLIFAAGA
jgi:hypothetical protein